MQILFPSDPFRTRLPDEAYAEEHQEWSERGLSTAVFSFESFLNGSFQPRPALEAEVPVLYRGWMLTPDQYAQLHQAVAAEGARLRTSPEAYERCHYLPRWYPLLAEFTPETRFFAETDPIVSSLRESGWDSCFLKDYVKSLGATGSMVRDLNQIPEVLTRMRKYRGTIEGGVCARRLESFLPDSEDRYLVSDGRVYGRSGPIPEVVRFAAERIASPFFTVDTTQRDDGTIRIIELGDGQVSDRKQWSAGDWVSALAGKVAP
ncbi:MAG: ATP-grasp domain-containing protein [Verrucomicrobia bacterium]|nr:ATP-grasp domain-containing protein [Verrucomicrobiota bacterium]